MLVFKAKRFGARLYFRGPPRAFSTAAQQRSTGDECGPEDPSEEPKHPLPDCALEHKAIKLEEQVRDLTERYRKALADSENVRRRTQKFVEDAKLFGIQSFCRDLVEVADILEKTAESAAGHAEPSDPNPTLKKIYEGLSLIEAKLQSVFAKHGLQKMNPLGGSSPVEILRLQPIHVLILLSMILVNTKPFGFCLKEKNLLCSKVSSALEPILAAVTRKQEKQKAEEVKADLKLSSWLETCCCHSTYVFPTGPIAWEFIYLS
ncbi:grpE protein homolog 2, mitochondrial isoform X1 [Hirundo rustica]|uniref:grpE protein homolog 2, mitochondrial isoform X1 n=1 Tax=Hirundo rustica TaxID=43150 RepID=UPI001A94B990|nr:grpE protein homolog 2, mitochondrial isoform X1 [Hirundo rustica]